MQIEQQPDPSKDTSQPGREEEVIVNSDAGAQPTNGNTAEVTNRPVKSPDDSAETEGERRFNEGLANNNDTETSKSKQ